MNQKIKKLWTSALRSGKYKQGKGGLCHGGPQGTRYCCLGVLSDLAVKNKVCSRRIAFRGNAFLNQPIINWAGLRSENPSINNYGLVEYNDGLNIEQKTFKEIADLIDKNL